MARIAIVRLEKETKREKNTTTPHQFQPHMQTKWSSDPTIWPWLQKPAYLESILHCYVSRARPARNKYTTSRTFWNSFLCCCFFCLSIAFGSSSNVVHASNNYNYMKKKKQDQYSNCNTHMHASFTLLLGTWMRHCFSLSFNAITWKIHQKPH